MIINQRLRTLIARLFIVFISACGGSDNVGLQESVIPDSDLAKISSTVNNAEPFQGKITINRNLSAKASFERAQEDLDILHGNDYEAIVSTSIQPNFPPFVELKVPSALAAKVDKTHSLSIYLEMPPDNEPGTFIPLESEYDAGSATLSAAIPVELFVENTIGTYTATLRIGLAISSENSISDDGAQKISVPRYGTPSVSKLSPSLSCPVNFKGGCIETSRKGPRIGGKSPYHYGIDLKAIISTDVLSAKSGIVTKVLPGTRKIAAQITVKHSSALVLQYFHLSSISVEEGDEVEEGEVLGKAGMTGADHIHLHVNMISFITPSTCKSAVKKCRAVKSYIDPFNHLLKKTKIERVTKSSEYETGQRFTIELVGEDKRGTPVSTQINNNDGSKVIGTIRVPEWKPSKNFSIERAENIDDNHNPPIGLELRNRNRAYVTVNLENDGNIYGRWESGLYWAALPLRGPDCNNIATKNKFAGANVRVFNEGNIGSPQSMVDGKGATIFSQSLSGNAGIAIDLNGCATIKSFRLTSGLKKMDRPLYDSIFAQALSYGPAWDLYFYDVNQKLIDPPGRQWLGFTIYKDSEVSSIVELGAPIAGVHKVLIGSFGTIGYQHWGELEAFGP